jgi:hypothetical protein
MAAYTCDRSNSVVLWLDKEQMSESGGDDWGTILTQAQKVATLAVFMLGNGYVSSAECVKEFKFGDMKKFKFVPVFLEYFSDSEAQFVEGQVPRLCDADRSTFTEWEKHKDVIDRLASQKQGAFSVLNMPDFVCPVCDKWFRKDTVCDRCRNWENALHTSSKAKFLEAARVVGKYIDAAARDAKLPVLPAAPIQPSQAHALRMQGRADPEPIMAQAVHDKTAPTVPTPVPQPAAPRVVAEFWRAPSQLDEAEEGPAIVGRRVRVDGRGAGQVLSFAKSKFGASAHVVRLDGGAEVKVKLARKGNGKTPWQVWDASLVARWN